MYFRNSQDRRDFPMPADPITDTRRPRLAALAWNRSLISVLAVAADERDSRPTERSSPPRSAITRTRARERHGSAFL